MVYGPARNSKGSIASLVSPKAQLSEGTGGLRNGFGPAPKEAGLKNRLLAADEDCSFCSISSASCLCMCKHEWDTLLNQYGPLILIKQESFTAYMVTQTPTGLIAGNELLAQLRFAAPVHLPTRESNGTSQSACFEHRAENPPAIPHSSPLLRTVAQSPAHGWPAVCCPAAEYTKGGYVTKSLCTAGTCKDTYFPLHL
eukprot:1158184-Pelagomonas_calceolata.AAC.10